MRSAVQGQSSQLQHRSTVGAARPLFARMAEGSVWLLRAACEKCLVLKQTNAENQHAASCGTRHVIEQQLIEAKRTYIASAECTALMQYRG